MNFLEKLKLNLFEQISFVGIIAVLFTFYFLLGVKVINILIIPGIITFVAYTMLKKKFLANIHKNSPEESEESLKEKESSALEKVKKLSYKIGVFIYLFYIEFYFLGLPEIEFLPFPFNNFIVFYILFMLLILVLKFKKIKDYEIYIYTYLSILFCIPIINEILEFIK